MKFTADAKSLNNLLEKAGYAINKRSPVFALQNYFMSIKKGELFVRGTDLNVDVTTSINVESDGEVKFLVNADLLKNLVSNIEGTISFAITKEKLKIHTETGEYNLGISDEKDFPAEVKLGKDEVEITCNYELKEALKFVEFAAAKEDLRPAMMGVYIEGNKNGLEIAATNGHKLSVYKPEKKENYSSKEIIGIIPSEAVKVLLKFMPEAAFKMKMNKSHIQLQVGPDIVCCRLIGEKYPDYKKIIPKDNELKSVFLRASIIAAVKRLNVFTSKENPRIILEFDKDHVQLSTANDHDDAVEKYECIEQDGEIKIGFNISYLMEVLANISGSEIEFNMKAPHSAVIMREKENEKGFILLMPVRLL